MHQRRYGIEQLYTMVLNVSLLVLRLEVEETCDEVPIFNYKAEEYFQYAQENEHYIETNDLSLTLKSERVVVPEDFKEIPALHQGKREFREVIIQTYYPAAMDADEDFTEEANGNGDEALSLTVPIEEEVEISLKCNTTDVSGECKTLDEDGESTTTESAEAEEGREHKLSESNTSDNGSPKTINYFSGNPSVEVTRGIMHLYKDKFTAPLDSNIPRSSMLCILGVPAKCTCQDLQRYIAPARDTILHIKIIRDSVPNQYMVLLRFQDQVSADIFYQEYDGKPFNLLESEVSHIVYVSKAEAVKSSQGGYLPVTNLTELPNCPVCLERMDESVAGILTVLCNHSFHNDCLMKWQDTCCPVCRYCQSPEPTAESTCFECESHESLWICVICGHIGCGRYQEQHAYQHYQNTAHTFSMHLGNQRVWDYAGDNYVHRLIQSKGDGKLVSLDNRALDNREEVDNEKMDSLTLEYTYLLTNQLASQRTYFEEKIEFLETDAYEKMSLMEASIHKTFVECDTLEKKQVEGDKERRAMDKKYENVVTKATNLAKELRDEKEMNACLRENQVAWQQQVALLGQKNSQLQEEKNCEVEELRSQLSDLMKHLEVQSAIGNAQQEIQEDIQGGHVFMEPSPSSSPPRGARARTRNRKR